MSFGKPFTENATVAYRKRASPSRARQVYIGHHPLRGAAGEAVEAVWQDIKESMGGEVLTLGPVSHWAVIIGDLYHELAIESGSCIYRTGHVSEKRGKWRGRVEVGRTTWNDRAITDAATSVIDKMDRTYKPLSNNCQRFSIDLLRDICVPGTMSYLVDRDTIEHYTKIIRNAVKNYVRDEFGRYIDKRIEKGGARGWLLKKLLRNSDKSDVQEYNDSSAYEETYDSDEAGAENDDPEYCPSPTNYESDEVDDEDALREYFSSLSFEANYENDGGDEDDQYGDEEVEYGDEYDEYGDEYEEDGGEDEDLDENDIHEYRSSLVYENGEDGTSDRNSAGEWSPEDNDLAQSGIHPNIMCDYCDQNISGIRYQCSDCADYDLCHTCVTERHAKGKHSMYHQFRELMPPTVYRAICDNCSERIVGVRHKCDMCSDYDLCDTCFDICEDHRLAHDFIHIEHSEMPQ